MNHKIELFQDVEIEKERQMMLQIKGFGHEDKDHNP